MKLYQQKLYLQLMLLFTVSGLRAQEVWPAPEIEQMYRHAQEYMGRGDLNDAVITYKQAIALAPDKIVLYKELGNAFYLSGKFAEAEETLSPVCAKPEADTTCYRLLAASQAAQNDNKKALSTLQKGLLRFPLSGLLYHEQGKVFTLEEKPEAALNAWLDGIAKEPEYAPNYYEASLRYLDTKKVLWGLLYGEIYLDIAHDTAGDENIKNKLFAGYKTLFDGFAAEEAPQYGKSQSAKPAKKFEEAVMQVYSRLTPVVSDGISTENLTMVRTRFLMDWFSGYGSKYPFSLFSYQDSLVSYGRFDIWNEWLFGKAESVPEYNAWNTFHDGAISRTRAWQSGYLLHPVVQDSYNDRDMDGLFKK
jgi:tetratricopeptide (TPR) repeat protein